MSVPLCEHKYAHLYKRVHVCDCVPLCKCVHSCPSFGKQMEASRDLPYSLLLGHILPLSQNWVWSCGHYCYLWPLAGFFSPLTTTDLPWDTLSPPWSCLFHVWLPHSHWTGQRADINKCHHLLVTLSMCWGIPLISFPDDTELSC